MRSPARTAQLGAGWQGGFVSTPFPGVPSSLQGGEAASVLRSCLVHMLERSVCVACRRDDICVQP